MPELETVDLLGVEILSTGGPVFGKGSPPEGDYWTADDLRGMAEADAELGDEIKPPGKIGHSDAQRLLGLTDGEMPAVGWVENVRVSDDGEKLLADFLRVPKKFAELVKSGAYRTRSVELSRVKSQTSGKVYDWVVTGVAWLGGKLPAVKTLDDVVALYEDRGLELELGRVVVYEQPPDGTVVWQPDGSANALRERLRERLNPAGFDGPNVLWVEDVSLDGNVALVCQSYDGDAFVVPFTIADDGTVTPAPQSEWVKAEKAWVAAAKTYAEQLVPGRPEGAADTRPEMPTFTAEQRKTFAEATGLEEEKVTDEMLAAAGVQAADAPKPEPRSLESDEKIRELSEEVTATKRELAEQRETARVERRRSFVEDFLLGTGRIEPGDREDWERSFDLDEQHARKLGAKLKPNEDLAREYGSDDEPTTEDEKRELEEREERDYESHASAYLGISKEALI